MTEPRFVICETDAARNGRGAPSPRWRLIEQTTCGEIDHSFGLLACHAAEIVEKSLQ
ncbi:MAG: hypothetical protein L0Z50_33200 [Verrucomicrobiales bacterium]|nr:hypothetical protein [Verrucomicrobiales bacterium]